MSRQDILDKLLKIVATWSHDVNTLKDASPSSSLTSDLGISSARFVDLILEIEDSFGVEIPDELADQVKTLGDAVSLVESLTD